MVWPQSSVNFVLQISYVQVHICGESFASSAVNCIRSQCLQIFRLYFCWVSGIGMAVNQVKRFQHLQEQRTQAFHELGTKWLPKKFQNTQTSKSKIFLVTKWLYSQQINITKSSFAMLQNMKRVLKNSRKGSGIFLLQKFCSKLPFCSPMQWCN